MMMMRRRRRSRRMTSAQGDRQTPTQSEIFFFRECGRLASSCTSPAPLFTHLVFFFGGGGVFFFLVVSPPVSTSPERQIRRWKSKERMPRLPREKSLCLKMLLEIFRTSAPSTKKKKKLG